VSSTLEQRFPDSVFLRNTKGERARFKKANLGNRKWSGWVHLQSYGKAPAVLVSDLKVGDYILYNYGYKSQVKSITPKGKASVVVETESAKDGKLYDRTYRLKSLIPILSDRQIQIHQRLKSKGYAAETFESDQFPSMHYGDHDSDAQEKYQEFLDEWDGDDDPPSFEEWEKQLDEYDRKLQAYQDSAEYAEESFGAEDENLWNKAFAQMKKYSPPEEEVIMFAHIPKWPYDLPMENNLPPYFNKELVDEDLFDRANLMENVVLFLPSCDSSHNFASLQVSQKISREKVVKQLKDWGIDTSTLKHSLTDWSGGSYEVEEMSIYRFEIPPTSLCDWSNAYVRDTYYDDDDGTGYTTFGQDCLRCNAHRRGDIGGNVSWDMNAETFGADEEFYEEYPAKYYQIDEDEGVFHLPATDAYWVVHGEDALTKEQSQELAFGAEAGTYRINWDDGEEGVTFDYEGGDDMDFDDEWTDRFWDASNPQVKKDAESFNAVVIAPEPPKGIVEKALMNHYLFQESTLRQALMEIENRVELGLMSVEEAEKRLNHLMQQKLRSENYATENTSKKLLSGVFMLVAVASLWRAVTVTEDTYLFPKENKYMTILGSASIGLGILAWKGDSILAALED